MNEGKEQNCFWQEIEKLGGTPAYNEVLRIILKLKVPRGKDIPGMLGTTHRTLMNMAEVSLGTVGRALNFWQSMGVIVVHPSKSRHEPTTIEYLGLPQLILEHPLIPIMEELKNLILRAEDLADSLRVVESKVDQIIRDTQNNELSTFRKSKPIVYGETDDGRTLYVISDEEV